MKMFGTWHARATVIIGLLVCSSQLLSVDQSESESGWTTTSITYVELWLVW